MQYCEICDEMFVTLEHHLTGRRHQTFANSMCNYDKLDELISSLPSLAQCFSNNSTLIMCSMSSSSNENPSDGIQYWPNYYGFCQIA